jgi:hypothetical protein
MENIQPVEDQPKKKIVAVWGGASIIIREDK